MAKIQVHEQWLTNPDEVFAIAKGLFTYGPGEDRATGYLYAEGEQPWPPTFAATGQRLLTDLEKLLEVRFETAAFQAYRNGAGCDWHTDTPFDVQAILSLGVTRIFGIRKPGTQATRIPVKSGDLVVMPSGFQQEWEHSVPPEDVAGERISLVFRTAVRS